jgi:omega-amidase
MSTLRLALGQYDTAWEDPMTSLERASRVIERAAAEGADLVALPETSTTGFTMESSRFAEPLEGGSVGKLAALAARHRIHVLAGVATRERDGGPGTCFNSALLFAPDGELISHYRKQRLFALGGEDAAYEAGNEHVISEIAGVRLAPFICYDLRFPELFRPAAPHVDVMILIANWPVARRVHWDVLSQARAIENQCYFATVNRVGSGGGVTYDGGSAVFGPWGELLGSAGASDATSGDLCCVTIDSAEVSRVRERYPFVQDCRADAEPARR